MRLAQRSITAASRRTRARCAASSSRRDPAAAAARAAPRRRARATHRRRARPRPSGTCRRRARRSSTLPTTRPGGKLAPRPLVTISSPTCTLAPRACGCALEPLDRARVRIGAAEAGQDAATAGARDHDLDRRARIADQRDVGVVAEHLVDAADRAGAGDHRHAGLDSLSPRSIRRRSTRNCGDIGAPITRAPSVSAGVRALDDREILERGDVERAARHLGELAAQLARSRRAARDSLPRRRRARRSAPHSPPMPSTTHDTPACSGAVMRSSASSSADGVPRAQARAQHERPGSGSGRRRATSR